ncbi:MULTISPECIES: hypothetical protein [unclassified Paenibacillus]|uniref:hypothetical protein n=1 Tax=unclassified Paenibacillus TaxID=185978 RepID=UPI00277FD8E2|nr:MULTISPECIES: hypothetical protein [unclassified Paenibacillus]MDQ0897656.1 hypothetical protein [Paenibacillus sp. V4I7]MDQ0916337.1 hypothetical protein [Paenibacillus sp. V4I5]
MRKKIKLSIIFILIVIIAFLGYSSAKKEAISVAFHGEESNYVVTGTEIVWFKLTPYWNVGYLLNGVEGNILIDPLTKEIVGEANMP